MDMNPEYYPFVFLGVALIVTGILSLIEMIWPFKDDDKTPDDFDS